VGSSGEPKRNFLWLGKSLSYGQGEARRLCEKYHIYVLLWRRLSM